MLMLIQRYAAKITRARYAALCFSMLRAIDAARRYADAPIDAPLLMLLLSRMLHIFCMLLIIFARARYGDATALIKSFRCDTLLKMRFHAIMPLLPR